ncbi:hypothetical protein J5X84_33500 [Streptosporangiaceae bacterium NEAU-GS5]|nr:hypothetical protein [Streptosporangiaceae bacterium NEAU-GS5]
MPESARPLWHGAPIDAEDLLRDGDYGRACAVPGFIDLISVGTHPHLDSSSATTPRPRHSCPNMASSSAI